MKRTQMPNPAKVCFAGFSRRRLFRPAQLGDISGGTGFQARRLAVRGYAVTAIDIVQSDPDSMQAFPVARYDGGRFPCADRSYDAVFSSNVLEHIEEPGLIHRECRRVLKPEGYCVHVVPTAAWRFWEAAGHHAGLAAAAVLHGPHVPGTPLVAGFPAHSLQIPRERLRPLQGAVPRQMTTSKVPVPDCGHFEIFRSVPRITSRRGRHLCAA
jgi:SAM-dependent methyltransferase